MKSPAPLLLLCTFGTLSLGILPLGTSARADELAVNLSLAHDSDYLAQGRDNIDGDGISWGTATVQYDQLSTYVSLGRADTRDYDEWNLGLIYELPLDEPFGASLGYQRIGIRTDEDCSDNELMAEMSYQLRPWLTPSIGTIYSTNAAGYFVELRLEGHWQPMENLSLSPYLLQGLDFGYASEHHDGRNHVQLGLALEYQFSDALSLNAEISHSHAQQDIRTEAHCHDTPQTEEVPGAVLDRNSVSLGLSWQF